MEMQTIEVNTQKKAERIIRMNKGVHRMHWQNMYSTDKTGGLMVKYLIFYYPIEV